MDLENNYSKYKMHFTSNINTANCNYFTNIRIIHISNIFDSVKTFYKIYCVPLE